MDKRSIIFVLLIGLTFLGVNLFFSYNQDQQKREEFKQQEAINIQKKTIKQEEISKRTAPLSSLPLVSLYEAAESQTPLAEGVLVGDNVLVLAWETPLQETLFFKDHEGKTQKLYLKTKETVKGGIALYTPENFTHLTIAALPNFGTYDVQLLSFPEGPLKPHVTLGEYQDGVLTTLDPVDSNAIILSKSDHTYLPLGLYQPESNLFVSLQNLPFYSNVVQYPAQVAEQTKEETQKFYVLENTYQQLVFTDVGGAIAEINLPFETAENKESVVKQIGFDRQIAKQDPANAHFPAHPYYTPDSQKIHSIGKVGGYYPLLRRDVFGKPPVKDSIVAPEYYAANIVSDYPEMANLKYEVTEFTKDRITFVAKQPHRKITKTFTIKNELKGAPYAFDLSIRVDGDSRGLWLTSGVPEVEIMSNSASSQIQYRIEKRGGKGEVEKLSLPKPKEVVSISSINADWVVNSNGYLGMIVDPLSDVGTGFKAKGINGTAIPTRLTVIDPEYQPYKASKYPGYELLLPLPSTGGKSDFRIFGGPFEESILKAVDTFYTNPETGYNPHYSSARAFYGWFSFISEPFAKLLFVVMNFFHTITHSWAFSIILLTVFLRVLLYPLNAWSFKAMRRMQIISPQIQAIQAKYKKEPKKAQAEIMKLYREKKVNPFSGCLPIIIQIPFLVGMFDLLKSSFQLRGAGFIPGWIDNLTAPDVLFSWKMPIFFIGNQFHLLPILLGCVMFIQQRFSSSNLPKNPNEWTDQQRQQRAMSTIMTIFFAVMFYHFPSGLNIYWLSSMILGILQQWITNKVLDKTQKQTSAEGKKNPQLKRVMTPKAKV